MSLLSVYDLYHTESRSIHDILLTYYFLFHKKNHDPHHWTPFPYLERAWLAGKRFQRRSCHAFGWRKMLGPRGQKPYNHNQHEVAAARGIEKCIISECLCMLILGKSIFQLQVLCAPKSFTNPLSFHQWGFTRIN